MDTGNGTFRPVMQEELENMKRAQDEKPSDRRLDKVFTCGETVQIKASKFAIRSIDWLYGIMTLKLLPEKKF